MNNAPRVPLHFTASEKIWGAFYYRRLSEGNYETTLMLLGKLFLCMYLFQIN